jgi:hypothetical protein
MSHPVNKQHWRDNYYDTNSVLTQLIGQTQCYYSIYLVIYFGTGNWTQGLVHARQVLYHKLYPNSMLLHFRRQRCIGNLATQQQINIMNLLAKVLEFK